MRDALAELMREQNTETMPLNDLLADARAGRLPAAFGRNDEVEELLEIMVRPSKANALLVGPAGCGKTAVVERLAQFLVAAGNSLPPALQKIRLFQTSAASLIAGGGVVGEIERRVQQLCEQLQRWNAVLFIDEIHQLRGAGVGNGRQTGDVANLLKPYIDRDALRVIGATTEDEYGYVMEDAAFERRFNLVFVRPLSETQTADLLQRKAERLGLKMEVATALKIARCGAMALPHRALPDAAVDVFDCAAATCRLHGLDAVSNEVVTRSVLRAARLPLDVPSKLKTLLADRDLAAAARTLLAVLAGEARPPMILETGSLEAAKRLAAVLGNKLEIGHEGVTQRLITQLYQRPFSVLELHKEAADAEMMRTLTNSASFPDPATGRRVPAPVVVMTSQRRSMGFVR